MTCIQHKDKTAR